MELIQVCLDRVKESIQWYQARVKKFIQMCLDSRVLEFKVREDAKYASPLAHAHRDQKRAKIRFAKIFTNNLDTALVFL